MTDNEIIKALECCGEEDYNFCSQCPLYIENHDNDFCQEDLHRASLDLINRQKAEILLFRKENTTLALDNSLKKKKIEELSEVLSDTIRIRYAEAKTEAVKEFAERLKEHKIDVDVSFGYGKEVYTEAVAVIEIDNLVKEMTGEGDDLKHTKNTEYKDVVDQAIKVFAEDVKMAFYYEFDEIIPSVMADKIDKLIEERLGSE